MFGSKQSTPQETAARSISTITTPIYHTKSNTTPSNGPVGTHKIKPAATSEVESTQDPDSWWASFLWNATEYGAVDPPHIVATLVEPTPGEEFVFEDGKNEDILDLDLFSRGQTTSDGNGILEIQTPSPSQNCNDHKPAYFSLKPMKDQQFEVHKSNQVGIPSLRAYTRTKLFLEFKI